MKQNWNRIIVNTRGSHKFKYLRNAGQKQKEEEVSGSIYKPLTIDYSV
jgi:hypothetical protein